jgi:hypothetical protein
VENRQRVLSAAREINNDSRVIGAGPQPNIADIDRARGLGAQACEQQSSDARREQTAHANKLTLNQILFQVKLDT